MATPIARLGAARAENLSTRELVTEITGRIVTTAATAGAATIMNRILGSALERFIDRYF